MIGCQGLYVFSIMLVVHVVNTYGHTQIESIVNVSTHIEIIFADISSHGLVECVTSGIIIIKNFIVAYNRGFHQILHIKVVQLAVSSVFIITKDFEFCLYGSQLVL